MRIPTQSVPCLQFRRAGRLTFLGVVLALFAGMIFYIQNTSGAQRGSAPARAGRTGASGQVTRAKSAQEGTSKRHPLEVPLAMARECAEAYKNVQDYSATFVKQERIDGKLTEENFIHLKIRERPFSVYLRWLKPNGGREVLYVEGRNNGKLIAHETGIKDAVAGTLELEPESKRALKSSRHAITEAGIGHLIETMVANWERELRYGEIDAKLFKNAQVDGRKCLCIQIYHPTPRREFQFCLSKIYIDEERKLPIRLEGYDWPRRKGEQPELVEVYTYTKLNLNPGLTDLDFDVRNPQYSFYK